MLNYWLVYNLYVIHQYVSYNDKYIVSSPFWFKSFFRIFVHSVHCGVTCMKPSSDQINYETYPYKKKMKPVLCSLLTVKSWPSLLCLKVLYKHFISTVKAVGAVPCTASVECMIVFVHSVYWELSYWRKKSAFVFFITFYHQGFTVLYVNRLDCTATGLLNVGIF